MNDDLLTEILLRLPRKSVARFKSVSHQFLSLISTTPQFNLPKPLNALISQSPTLIHTPLLIPLHHDDDEPTRSLNRTFSSSSSSLSTHSCNGLLLCCLLDAKTRKPSLSKFVVSNPTSNQHATLPQKYPLFFHTVSAYLAFDPKVKQQYDVVCFCTSGRSDTHVMIYSSKKKKWRIAGFLRDTVHSYGGGVFHNGYIYWASLPLGHDPEARIKPKLSLYRFHVQREKMERVALPRGASEFEYVLYLGLCRGRLHLVTGVYDSGSDYDIEVLNVYEVKKGSDEWCLRYSLGDVARDLRSEYWRIKVVPTVDCWRFEHVNVCKVAFFEPEERCLYFEVGRVIARYDFGARTVVKVFDHKDIGSGSETCYSQHMEILYSDGLTQSRPDSAPCVKEKSKNERLKGQFLSIV